MTKTMGKFKKLIPAICMLLISAVLMGTSTFAWFSMNKTVTATGMQVKARAEGGILIKRSITTAAATGTSVDFGTSTVNELLPISTKDTSAWYHAEAEKDTASTAKSGTYKEITMDAVDKNKPSTSGIGVGAVGDSIYYVYDSITVTPDANSSKFTDLWVSGAYVTITDTTLTSTQNLSKALRIAFVYDADADGGSDKVVIAAPVSGATPSYGVNDSGTTDVTVLDTSSTSTTVQLSKTDSSTLLTGEVETALVRVYIYFEGEDAALFTNNITGIQQLKITVNFSCTSVAPKAST